MPPKNATLKKAENKKKEKVIEDKTFGLKNKKGGKAQKYIANVEKQVKGGGNPDLRKLEAEREKAKREKEEAAKREQEMKALFKPASAVQKVENGVDPKTVFCAFFKQNLCKKGNNCKFSHDPAVERKAVKRNIYEAKDDADENMDEWDEEKLAEVVNKKHGSEKPANATDIICKMFLDAVENSKYGWFWECPIGKSCKYKHALPPGFVLKKDRKKAEKEQEGITLEDLIEKERAQLDTSKSTKVTLESFVAWKKKKLKEKAMAEKKDKEKKKKELKSGTTSGMSGRDMFMLDPTMLGQHADDEDDDGEDFDLNMREKDEDDGVKVHEIKFDAYGIMDDGVDDSTDVQLAKARGEDPAAVGGAAAAVDVDEDLFDDEDLDELEEDLDALEV